MNLLIAVRGWINIIETRKFSGATKAQVQELAGKGSEDMYILSKSFPKLGRTQRVKVKELKALTLMLKEMEL